jgi:hypothetical protein
MKLEIDVTEDEAHALASFLLCITPAVPQNIGLSAPASMNVLSVCIRLRQALALQFRQAGDTAPVAQLVQAVQDDSKGPGHG